MTAPIVVGLDLSITATGVCWRVSPNAEPTCETWGGKASDGDRRLFDLADRVVGLLDDDTDLVVIEGPVMRSQAASVSGMVHGAVRVELISHDVPYAIVAPATLKKFATGKGTADKTAMTLALYKRAGLELADDNQVDAWWLWAAGMTHLGHPPVQLPADQVAALDKVTWP